MIHILMLEDRPADAELTMRHLRRSRLESTVVRVTTEDAFRRELLGGNPDVILADYEVPGFGGMQALQIAHDLAPDIPFIFVTGSMSDARAAAALREGALDYIQKDRPERLTSAVERAIADRRAREAQRRMQESLRESEQRFHVAARATCDVIWDWNRLTGRMWVNDSIRTVWGHPVDPEVSRDWWQERIHPDDRERVHESLERLWSGQESRWICEYRFVRAGGEYGFALDRAVLVSGHDGRAVRAIGAMQDVTEIRSAMAALDEAQRIAHLGSWSYDYSTGRATWSDETRRIFGIGPDEKVDRDLYLALTHPDDRERVSAIAADADATDMGTLEYDHRIIRRDGSRRHVFCRIGGHDPSGRLCGTLQDVTEWRRLQSEVEGANRVALLGRIAASITHEFNNVLMGIQPFADLITRKAGDDEGLARAAASISAAVMRGRTITGDILRVTQPPQPSGEEVDIGNWLRDIARDIESLLPGLIRLSLEFEASEPAYGWIDRSHVQQVLTNLVLNARDAMLEGTIRIVTRDLEDAGRIRIDVSDSGSGISPDAVPYIFQPLFTTKRNGTGLGLAVAHQLIASLNGTITVDSEVGRGSTFHVDLQRTGAPLPQAPLPPAPEPQVTAGRKVLIVDDDEAVGIGLAALLSLEGMDCQVAVSGTEAIDALETRTPDVILIDLSLGDMSGTHLHDLICGRWPDLPVIFSTGSADTTAIAERLTRPNVMLLRKPYAGSALLQAVEQLTREPHTVR